MKEKVYVNKPETCEHLNEEIRHVISEIQPHLYENVIENFNIRITLCQRFRDGHLPDISRLIGTILLLGIYYYFYLNINTSCEINLSTRRNTYFLTDVYFIIYITCTVIPRFT